MEFLYNILNLVRIKDWLKNIIIIIPLIFSGSLSNTEKYMNVLMTLIIFSLTSSIIYIINDIIDVEKDKVHNIKKIIKPLANGKLSIKLAKWIILILLLILIFFIYFYNRIILHISAYFLLNLIYNFFLKQIAILDIFIIAFGYVIRVDSGSYAIDVQSSYLMLLSIFSLAFFTLAIKRKNEFLYNFGSRKSLKAYNKSTLNFLIIIPGIASFAFFAFYVFTKSEKLLVTLPLVFIALLRYGFISSTNLGEFPIDAFFKDKILLFFGIIFSFIIIYNFV